MDTTYVEQREQDYWISNSRVSLASVVLAFRDGLAPETIAAECFPTLSLEQVYGAITYYLSHRQEVDTYLQQRETAFTALQKATTTQLSPVSWPKPAANTNPPDHAYPFSSRR